MEIYREGDIVTIHSLGESHPGEYRGIIRGLSATAAYVNFYIVELVDSISNDYDYTCCTMPEACLRRGWPRSENQAMVRMPIDTELP